MESHESPIEEIKHYFISGAILIVPTVITLIILLVVFNFLSNLVSPVTAFIFGNSESTFALLMTLLLMGAVIVLFGFIAENLPTEGELSDVFHASVETIPGIGSVYGSFRQMSETVVKGEDSFRAVKLVEFPNENSYSLAFVTADTPEQIEDGVGGKEMTTLFLPMGPNPVMGGYVIYVPDENVYDIDITVEEGLQAIITSGVALNDEEEYSVKGEIKELRDFYRNRR